MENVISVIVPIYNSEKYLEACLNSIIKQIYRNLEIILIDDGSKDNSFSIAQNYSQSDERIVLLRQENGGQASARNLGLEKATGDFIAFVDSDDTISPDYFSANMSYFNKNSGLEIVQIPVFFNYGSNREKLKINEEHQINSTPEIFKQWIELGNVTWIICDKIFKRSLLKNLKFEEGMVYEDNYLLVSILKKTLRIQLSSKGIYYYHHRLGSTMQSSHSLKKDLDTQKVSIYLFSTLLNFPDLKTARIKIFNRIVNVYLSLAFNFNYYYPDRIPKLVRNFRFSFASIKKLNIPNKEKLRLSLLKCIGLKNYLNFFLKVHSLNNRK